MKAFFLMNIDSITKDLMTRFKGNKVSLNTDTFALGVLSII